MSLHQSKIMLSPIDASKYKSAINKLNRAIRPIGGGSLNWAEIQQRFINYTVKDGFNGGRMLALEINGFYFGFYDGAHNCYSWMTFNHDEFSEFLTEIKTRDTLDKLKEDAFTQIEMNFETDIN